MDMKDTREKLSMSFYDRFLLLMREIKDKRVLIVDSKSEKNICEQDNAYQTKI